VVTTENERHVALAYRAGDAPGDAPARLLDLVEVAQPLVPDARRFRHGGRHISQVHAADAELAEPVRETRVANRGRAHVDTPAAGAQVEACPDHGHRRGRFLHAGDPTDGRRAFSSVQKW
jgi:hypothetical protein